MEEWLDTRGTRTVKGYMTDSQMAVMVTVLPIVMSSVKQKYGPSLNIPKTVLVNGRVAILGDRQRIHVG